MNTEGYNKDLMDLVKAVPTLHLKAGELEGGAPAIFAGNEPVFRCRSTDLGQQYAALAVMAIERLAGVGAAVTPLAPKACPPTTALPTSSVSGDLDQRVTSVLSLHPEFSSTLR